MTTIADDPNYQVEATQYSKSIIFIFIGTFLYRIFIEGLSAGYIGGFIFLLIGVFAVSILIAMPIFILSKKVTKVSWILRILGQILSIYVTYIVMGILFT